MEKPSPWTACSHRRRRLRKDRKSPCAAFKTIQDGYQVAGLVPPTLLVTQHARCRRTLRRVPIAHRYPRASPPRRKPKSRQGWPRAKIDLVIGTPPADRHRPLQEAQRRFIIDEQRFGVEQETLKALRRRGRSIHVRHLPRTSDGVSGIHQMSILEPPPEERQPVPDLRRRLREMPRSAPQSGASCCAMDRGEFACTAVVDSISSVAAHISKRWSEGPRRTAHGKMNEHPARGRHQDFWNHEFDVLVLLISSKTGPGHLQRVYRSSLTTPTPSASPSSTSCRGARRTGRERAYAYFFYPGDKV